MANKLRLLQLPVAVLERLSSAGLGERHARAILPLVGDARLEAAVNRIVSEKLTVEQVERLVESLKSQKPQGGGRILVIKELRLFTNAISKAIDAMNEAGIKANTKKVEDEESITYTITIPKKAVKRPHLKRNQAPPESAAF